MGGGWGGDAGAQWGDGQYQPAGGAGAGGRLWVGGSGHRGGGRRRARRAQPRLSPRPAGCRQLARPAAELLARWLLASGPGGGCGLGHYRSGAGPSPMSARRRKAPLGRDPGRASHAKAGSCRQSRRWARPAGDTRCCRTRTLADATPPAAPRVRAQPGRDPRPGASGELRQAPRPATAARWPASCCAAGTRAAPRRLSHSRRRPWPSRPLCAAAPAHPRARSRGPESGPSSQGVQSTERGSRAARAGRASKPARVGLRRIVHLRPPPPPSFRQQISQGIRQAPQHTAVSPCRLSRRPRHPRRAEAAAAGPILPAAAAQHPARSDA